MNERERPTVLGLLRETRDLMAEDLDAVDRDIWVELNLVTLHKRLSEIEASQLAEAEALVYAATLMLYQTLAEDYSNAVEVWNRIEQLVEWLDE